MKLDFPPGEPVEIIMRGMVLRDGLHILDMVIDMELAAQVIPMFPLLLRGGVADVPILEDRFNPLPEWPPTSLEPGRVHDPPRAFVFKGAPPGAALKEFGALRCTPDDVLVSVLERNATGGFMLRLWEATGQARHARIEPGWQAARAFKTDMLERRERELAFEDNHLDLPLDPFEIVTLVIE